MDNSFLNHPLWSQVQKNNDTSDLNKARIVLAHKKENWSREIAEIKQYFSTATLPDHSIMIDDVLVVNNVKGYIAREMETVYAQNGVPTFRPYLNRVISVMRFLQDLESLTKMASA